MRRRGFIFTLDALLALLVALIVITSITITAENVSQVHSSVMRVKNVYTAEDVITIISKVPLNSLVNSTVISNWEKEGIINESLYVNPSMPPLRIALIYWALSKIPDYSELNLVTKAGVILDYVIKHSFPGYGFEVKINSTVVANFGNSELASDVTSKTILISGFKKGERPFGYVARAYLTSAQHTYSQLIGIQRVVAYGGSNTMNVDVPITLPHDAVGIIAKGAFYARITPTNDMYLEVTNSSGTYRYGDLGSGDSVDLSSYIGPGDNVLHFQIDANGADEVGFGSGSVLLVSYTTNTTSVESPDKINLYDIKSDYGFVQFITVVPTGTVNGVDIYLEASGINAVHLYYTDGVTVCDMGLSKRFNAGIVYFNSTQIEEGLARCGVSYSDLNNRAFTLVLGLDATWPSGSSKPSYDRTSRLRHLYGFGRSYVQVEVTSKATTSQYAIPLSTPLWPENFKYSDSTNVDSSVYKVMRVSYTLPPKALPWYADYWIAIMYRGTPSGTLSFTEENPEYGQTQILKGDLNYYLYRFGYARYPDTIMVNGTTNTFSAESTSNYYGFREGDSWGNIYYFLRAYAPYGDKFPHLLQGYPEYKGYNLTYWAKLYGTSDQPIERYILVGDKPYKDIDIVDLNPDKYALDDALIRLFTNLAVGGRGRPGTQENPLGVYLPHYVNADFVPMSVPSLFEPVPVEIRIWRRG